MDSWMLAIFRLLSLWTWIFWFNLFQSFLRSLHWADWASEQAFAIEIRLLLFCSHCLETYWYCAAWPLFPQPTLPWLSLTRMRRKVIADEAAKRAEDRRNTILDQQEERCSWRRLWRMLFSPIDVYVLYIYILYIYIEGSRMHIWKVNGSVP